MPAAKPKTALFMRVSTSKQTHDRQRTILADWIKTQGLKAESVSWYRETVSATSRNRQGLDRLIKDVESGKVHTVAFERLDRLARSTRKGLELLAQLASANVRVVCVQQNFEFNGAMGRLLSTIFLAVAEWERDLLSARIAESMRTVRDAGKHVGRPRDAKRREQVQRLRQDEHLSVAQIAEKIGTSRQNIYYLLKESKVHAAN